MSIETDIVEIKATLDSMNRRFADYINHAGIICEMKHKEIECHLKDAPAFRDKVTRYGGQMTVLLSIVSILLVGILGIALALIQNVLTK